MPFTDIDARRRAAILAAQLPGHLPDALKVIHHMAVLARYNSGLDISRYEAGDICAACQRPSFPCSARRLAE